MDRSRLAAWVLVCSVVAAGTAHADEADRLVEEGEALARAGDPSGAVSKFKAADKAVPKTRHSCLVGLAYLRMQRWGQAEVAIGRCRSRATSRDPAPDWIGEAEKQLETGLATAKVAPVTFVVTPAVDAQLAISTFGEGEDFRPRMLHLAPGSYKVAAVSSGYAGEQTFQVTGTAAQTVTVQLRAILPDSGEPLPVGPTEGAPPKRRARWVFLGAGVLLGGAIASHATAYHYQGKLDDSEAAFDKYEGRYDTFRVLTYGLYIAAGLTAGAGFWLWRSEKNQVRVTGEVGAGGGSVWLEWRR